MTVQKAEKKTNPARESEQRHNKTVKVRDEDLSFRKPIERDGHGVFNLVKDSPPLDLNSMYSYLLLCSHFADTSALVEHDGKPVGFLSAYIPPNEPDTLFVWQVAVAKEARGLGLATRMIEDILARPALEHVEQIKTTITMDNEPSWRLFKSFAKSVDANCTNEVMFCRKEHFRGVHDTEHLVTISPLDNDND